MITSVLFLFVSAADILGTWQLKSKDADGKTILSAITFRNDAGQLKAVIKADGKSIEANRIKKEDDKAIFEIQWEDDLIAIELTPNGQDKISGLWRSGDDSGPIEGTRAASLAGLWKLTATRPNGSTTKVDLDVNAEGDKLVPSLRTPEGMQIPLDKIAIANSTMSFDILAPQATIKVQLKLEGSAVKGTWTTPDGNSGPLEGVR